MPYPSSSLYPSSGLFPASPVLDELRGRPPLRLMLDVETPDGKHFRWAPDEPHPANVPSGLSFSSTMPGGFEQLSVTLPRKPGLEYADLAEFSTITAYGPGGQIAWQGRLETTPRTSGNQMTVTPGAVGYQAHLDDDKSARMVYIDMRLSAWQGASVQRKLSNSTNSADTDDAGVANDPISGTPALEAHFTGAWSRQHNAEGWYDARGLDVGALYYAWEKNSAINHTLTEWQWLAQLSTNGVTGFPDSTGNLRALGPGSGTLTAGGTGRKWAMVQLADTIASGADGVDYAIFWTALAVLGNHGIAPRGTWTGTPGSIGFYGSDIVTHAVSTWAPKLALSRAGQSTIATGTFIVPQVAFLDPTTASVILKEAIQYEPLLDWWVDEGPTFHLASRANHGRRWRARVGPSGLQETGPQVERMCNRVIVGYNDLAGIARTVGPTGSGADTIDDTLADTSPTNPVTAAGLVIYPPQAPNIGTSTPAGAIAVGQRLLAEQQQAVTSGQATIVGHVQDDHGVWWPAWMIRAGDWVSFTDAHDVGYRRITKASYTDSSRSCQVDLDSPPDDMASLLARMAEAVAVLSLA